MTYEIDQTEQGQLGLPPGILEQLGLAPGMHVAVTCRQGALQVTPLEVEPGAAQSALDQVLADPRTGEAWAEAAASEENGNG